MPQDTISITSREVPSILQPETRNKNILRSVPRDKNILKPVPRNKAPAIEPDRPNKMLLAKNENQKNTALDTNAIKATQKGNLIDMR